MLIFLVNLVYSLVLKRELAADNPWQSKSLEWQIPTPVPPHNFDTIPTITGDPYGYGFPDEPVVDWSGPQTVPAGAGA
jgi:cytochrome c oxidase subunit 1